MIAICKLESKRKNNFAFGRHPALLTFFNAIDRHRRDTRLAS